MKNRRWDAVYAPEPFDDLPRFFNGHVGPYGRRLLPVCCPGTPSLTIGPQSPSAARIIPGA
jgi:hypothetical protein